MRPPFLVDVPSAESREAEAGHGASRVTNSDNWHVVIHSFNLQDEPDDDEDEDDEDEFREDDEDDDEDDEDDEGETWQVCRL
jgi:hypothetical protein